MGCVHSFKHSHTHTHTERSHFGARTQINTHTVKLIPLMLLAHSCDCNSRQCYRGGCLCRHRHRRRRRSRSSSSRRRFNREFIGHRRTAHTKVERPQLPFVCANEAPKRHPGCLFSNGQFLINGPLNETMLIRRTHSYNTIIVTTATLITLAGSQLLIQTSQLPGARDGDARADTRTIS